MSLPFKLGLLAISLIASSIMIFYSAVALESISDTQQYVSEQNESDALLKRQSRLSSYDFRYVNDISIQEVLTLIFNETSNSTPVIVKGADNTIKVYSSTGGWTYSSGGTPLGYLIDSSGSYYNMTGMSTYIGTVSQFTVAVPSYNDLYSVLRGTSTTEPTYLVNTDPDYSGEYKVILVVKK